MYGQQNIKLEINRLKLLYTYGISSANFKSQTQLWDINFYYATFKISNIYPKTENLLSLNTLTNKRTQ
jgi:hypothetical protein